MKNEGGNKMKKLAIFLSLCMTVSMLAGCGNKAANDDTSDKAADTTTDEATPTETEDAGKTDAADTEKKVIAMIPKTLNNPFFVAIKDEVEAMAAELGYEVVVNAPDAETEVDKQVSIVETFVEQGVDAIILGPATASALVDVINKADEKGIPVFLVDSGSDECAYQAFVGTDNYKGGQEGAKWIGENVKGKVVILDGYSGNDATTQRQKGFMDEIKNYPDVEVAASEYANCEISKGMEVTENFLMAYPDLAGIFAVNDMMAIGAGQAVEAAGKRDQIQICGFDGQPDAAQKIIEGTIDATIAQKPATMGKTIVQTIDDYFNGKEIERNVDTGCDVVNKENAETYLTWQ